MLLEAQSTLCNRSNPAPHQERQHKTTTSPPLHTHTPPNVKLSLCKVAKQTKDDSLSKRQEVSVYRSRYRLATLFLAFGLMKLKHILSLYVSPLPCSQTLHLSLLT